MIIQQPKPKRSETKIVFDGLSGFLVARSQARSLLLGLEKFKTIILDFDKVPIVGQAFADEIFRIFQNKYPKITITSINMNDAVEFMIRRVGK